VTRHRHIVRAVALGGLVALALLLSTLRPAPAAAATPCWKALLNDWYDGRIDNTYPLHCYRDALRHLPADVQTYSSAHDDIVRALQTAEARLKKQGTKVTANTPIPPATGGSSGGGSGHASGGSTTTTGTSTTAAGETTTSSPGHDTGNGINGVADSLNTSSPSSVPLPLIVLGALALLLVAAGAVGLIAKRRQGRGPSKPSS
jgi:cobalamin biosynthesis Mg chelatase CobN